MFGSHIYHISILIPQNLFSYLISISLFSFNSLHSVFGIWIPLSFQFEKSNFNSFLCSPLVRIATTRGWRRWNRHTNSKTFHPSQPTQNSALSPLPPTTNLEPTTIDTTKATTKRKPLNYQMKIQPSATPTKRKSTNHQYHHQWTHKPTSITTQALNHIHNQKSKPINTHV